MTIAVVGPNAGSRRALMGNYHGTASRYITVLEGIQDAAERAGAQVLYAQGSHLFQPHEEGLSGQGGYDTEKLEALRQSLEALPPAQRVEKLYDMAWAHNMPDRIAEAQSAAACADVVVVVTGLDETLEGEEGDTGNAYASGDKNDLQLPAGQRKLLEAMVDTGKPVVVVNMTGSAVDLSLAQERANAVLQAWYPGSQGGRAVAQVLFGEASPSGKLPVTFYRGVEDLPDFTDYAMAGRTYRYYQGEPLYPFGYGLTYGDCQVASAAAQPVEEGLRLRVTLANRGAATGEVLQVYVKDTDSPWAAPHPALAAFARVELDQGQEKEVELLVPRRAFTTVDDEGVRAVRGKHFRVYVGFSQPDSRSTALLGKAPLELAVEL